MAQRPDPEVKVGMGDGGGAELHLPLLRGALAGIIRYPHSRPDVAEGLGPWHSLGFCVSSGHSRDSVTSGQVRTQSQESQNQI